MIQTQQDAVNGTERTAPDMSPPMGNPPETPSPQPADLQTTTAAPMPPIIDPSRAGLTWSPLPDGSMMPMTTASPESQPKRKRRSQRWVKGVLAAFFALLFAAILALGFVLVSANLQAKESTARANEFIAMVADKDFDAVTALASPAANCAGAETLRATSAATFGPLDIQDYQVDQVAVQVSVDHVRTATVYGTITIAGHGRRLIAITLASEAGSEFGICNFGN